MIHRGRFLGYGFPGVGRAGREGVGPLEGGVARCACAGDAFEEGVEEGHGGVLGDGCRFGRVGWEERGAEMVGNSYFSRNDVEGVLMFGVTFEF